MPISKQLYEKIKPITTIDQLDKFYKEVTNQPINENNIVELTSAFILAASNIFVQKYSKLFDKNRSGETMWTFIRSWLPEFAVSPLRMLIYEDLLYPEFARNFKTISQDILVWLQATAKNHLERYKDASTALKVHWQSIVDGKIPYNLMLEKEYDKLYPIRKPEIKEPITKKPENPHQD